MKYPHGALKVSTVESPSAELMMSLVLLPTATISLDLALSAAKDISIPVVGVTKFESTARSGSEPSGSSKPKLYVYVNTSSKETMVNKVSSTSLLSSKAAQIASRI